MIPGLEVIPLAVREKIVAERVFNIDKHGSATQLTDDEYRLWQEAFQGSMPNYADWTCKDGLCAVGALVVELTGEDRRNWGGPECTRAFGALKPIVLGATDNSIESEFMLFDALSLLIDANDAGWLTTKADVERYLLGEPDSALYERRAARVAQEDEE